MYGINYRNLRLWRLNNDTLVVEVGILNATLKAIYKLV